jgi:hypothetical protein
VKVNRIIRKQLHDADGTVVGDVNAAIAANVGESGGAHTHVSSHTRIVQSTRSERAPGRRSSPAAPPPSDETKEES